jgi:hypothetical protein
MLNGSAPPLTAASAAGVRGGEMPTITYRRAWIKARQAVLAPAEQASPGSAAIRPTPRMPVDVAQRRRLPDPGGRVGRPWRRRAAADLRQVRCRPGRARQAQDQRSTQRAAPARKTGEKQHACCLNDTATCIWQPVPSAAAHGRDGARSHESGITAGQQPRTRAFKRWGHQAVGRLGLEPRTGGL